MSCREQKGKQRKSAESETKLCPTQGISLQFSEYTDCYKKKETKIFFRIHDKTAGNAIFWLRDKGT